MREIRRREGMRPFTRLILVFIFPFIAGGCIYLQDQASLKTAQDANAKFNDFRKTSSTVYDTMIANQAAVEKEAEDAETRAGAENDAAVANSLPVATWNDLRTGIQGYSDAVGATRGRLSSDLNGVIVNCCGSPGHDQAASLG